MSLIRGESNTHHDVFGTIVEIPFWLFEENSRLELPQALVIMSERRCSVTRKAGNEELKNQTPMYSSRRPRNLSCAVVKDIVYTSIGVVGDAAGCTKGVTKSASTPLGGAPVSTDSTSNSSSDD